MKDRPTRGLSTAHRVAGMAGNVMEWYDFALFGYLATVIGPLFFPHADRLSQVLSTFGVFAAGFLMRPIGAILFGHLGDRIGRKRALMLSIVMMALPTFLLGCLPTYAVIGIWAPILLTLIRLFRDCRLAASSRGRSLSLRRQRTRIVAVWRRAGVRPERWEGSCSVPG